MENTWEDSRAVLQVRVDQDRSLLFPTTYAPDVVQTMRTVLNELHASATTIDATSGAVAHKLSLVLDEVSVCVRILCSVVPVPSGLLSR